MVKQIVPPKPIIEEVVEEVVEETEVVEVVEVAEEVSEIAPVAEATPAPPEAVITDDSLAVLRAVWLSSVQREVERVKRYPRQARKSRTEGEVVIHLTVTQDGTVKEYTIPKGRRGVLERATLQSMARLSQLAPIPNLLKEKELTIKIPLVYQLQ